MTPDQIAAFYKTPETHPLWERQINLELFMLQKGAEQFRERLEESTSKKELTNIAPQRRLLQEMLEPTAQAIALWCKDGGVVGKGTRPVALKYLRLLDPMVAALIAVRTLLDQMVPRKINLTNLALEMGGTFEYECKMVEWTKLDPKQFYSINKNQKKDGSSPIHIRRVNINLYNKLAAEEIKWVDWTDDVKLRVGLALLDLVIQATGAFEIIPDPTTKPTKGRNKKFKPPLVLAPTAATTTWLQDALATAEVMYPHYLPTVVPPRRWSNPRRGAYWSRFVRAPLMIRFKANQQMQRARAIDEFMAMDLKGAYGAINRIQEVPWKINKRVLEVAKAVWERGKGEAGLPHSKPMEMPAKPHDIAENYESRRVWRREAAKVWSFNAKLFSHSITARRTFEIADMFAQEDRFYFPHMYDFRGRMYPIPVALQPQGGDLARGLLTFAEGKPVDGAEGWLAVQVANTWGNDKVSYEERLEWVEERRELWERIAADPIGNRDWMTCDSPWQCLAAIFELVAMRQHGPGYVSSLPIRIDGTCNGLQHLAIMSGDEEVARAVNVLPSEKPEDIYQKVADLATTKLAAYVGEKPDKADLAEKWLEITKGRLPRSLTKRPVMILPYGGTLSAFTEYTLQWLRENRKAEWVVQDEDIFSLATFMARLLWETVQTGMGGPMKVMRWLKECSAVAASGGAPVYWVTPAGFVVRHFYGKMKERQIDTKLDGRRIQLKLWTPTDELNKADQTRGIAPNFVHSQDASVLIGCVQSCKEEGVESITTIHDSFGTVAADMGKLGSILRHCFVANYSDSVLTSFREACLEVTPSDRRKDIPPVPDFAAFDLQQILDSDYFFA